MGKVFEVVEVEVEVEVVDPMYVRHPILRVECCSSRFRSFPSDPLPLPSPFSTDTKPSIGRPPTPLLRRLPAARRPPPRRRRRLPRPLFHMGNLLWPEPRLHPGRPKVLALRAHHRRLRRLRAPQLVPERQAQGFQRREDIGVEVVCLFGADTWGVFDCGGDGAGPFASLVGCGGWGGDWDGERGGEL